MPNNSTAVALPGPPSNTPPVAAAPVASAGPKKKAHPGELNKRQTAEVEKLEALIPICREPGAVGPMGQRTITEEFLTAAEERIRRARGTSIGVANCTVTAQAFTIDEGRAKARLLKMLRYLQQAARLKYQESHPLELGRYMVGQRIGQSRAFLEQSAHAIITSADKDRPPTVDAEMIEEAWGLWKDYQDSAVPQVDEKAAAVDARVTRDGLVGQIIADRQRIQTAADSAWPYTEFAHAGWRLKFRLPLKRPYVA